MEGKKRLLTGLQPSGQLHIGNYFGALKPFVELSREHESFLMVADYHALTTLKNPEELRRNSIDIVKDYIAAGVDPEKAVIFKQSDVLEHTELAWIFECLVTVPFLMQAHAYKDKTTKGIEPTAGLFNYPMLMAADILLYDTDIVPVGQDQRQHVEYAREAAAKFNRAYYVGEKEIPSIHGGPGVSHLAGHDLFFKEPKEHVLEEIATVPGTDGRKMSKSYGNTIPLFGSREEITRAVMSIVTDSSGERPEHVYAIHKLFKSEEELAPLYEANKGKYQALKEALIEDIDEYFAAMREKRENISDDEVKRVLAAGAEKARAIASAKMKEVRERIGVN